MPRGLSHDSPFAKLVEVVRNSRLPNESMYIFLNFTDTCLAVITMHLSTTMQMVRFSSTDWASRNTDWFYQVHSFFYLVYVVSIVTVVKFETRRGTPPVLRLVVGGH
jgi:choline-glycine betaine transporter